MPERTEPWTGDYEILWSIYIRCNNRQKLHRVHIPALETIMASPTVDELGSSRKRTTIREN
ncbi:hypothetical protein B5V01_04765 [Mesorhizobium erdmanii]|uniref:Uncharacterized protein n=2 Tax=Mesorhizobium TaxID=68287 RepID=A0A3M9X0F6_9HYPH|nr:hypothetical protein DNR46_35555 [Mesorhizobium japonicum]RXT50493.1 hypothetical protein B5V01_04765 [Mesorhizobium erdmanii]